MQRFTAACAQFAITPMDAAANTAKAAAWTRRAVDETGAQLVVLPETVTTGFVPDVGPDGLWDTVDALPGRFSEPLQGVAQALGVYLVFPSYERGAERGVVYNSAALIGPSGDVLGIYRKTHLFPTERLTPPPLTTTPACGWSTPGSDPVVIHTPLASIGLIRLLRRRFPGALPRHGDHGRGGHLPADDADALLRDLGADQSARAYDNHVYMVACNGVGPDAGGNYYFGHSMIVDPIAHKLAQGRGTEEVVFAELNPDPIKFMTYGTKTPMTFDHLADRNLDAYRNILTPAKSRFEPGKRQT